MRLEAPRTGLGAARRASSARGSGWSRRARGKFALSAGRAAGARDRPSRPRRRADRHASTTTPATRPPRTSARRSRGRPRSCSPTTTPATGSAPPPRAASGTSAARATRPRRARPGSLGSFYSLVTLLLGMKFGRARVQGDGAGALRAGRGASSAPPPRSARSSTSSRTRRPASPGGAAGRAIGCCWRARWASASTRSPAAPSRSSRNRCCAGRGSCARATAASGWRSAAACS